MGTDPQDGPEAGFRGRRAGEEPDYARFRPKPLVASEGAAGTDAGGDRDAQDGTAAADDSRLRQPNEEPAPGGIAGDSAWRHETGIDIPKANGGSGANRDSHAGGPNAGGAELEEERWREDHWPFAAPPLMPIVTPPPSGSTTYPRAMPLPPQAARMPSWDQSQPGRTAQGDQAAVVRHPNTGDHGSGLISSSGTTAGLSPLTGFPGVTSWQVGAEAAWWAWDGRPLLSQPLYGATFTQALRRFVAKHNRFAGFASPSEFWWVVLAQSFAWAIIVISGAFLHDPSMGAQPSAEPNEAIMGVFGMVAFALMLVTLVPNLALLTRRLHDAGLPGGLGFIALIPGLGWFCLLICMMLPSRNPVERNPAWEDRRGD